MYDYIDPRTLLLTSDDLKKSQESCLHLNQQIYMPAFPKADEPMLPHIDNAGRWILNLSGADSWIECQDLILLLDELFGTVLHFAWAKAALEEYKKTGKKPQGAPNQNTDRIV